MMRRSGGGGAQPHRSSRGAARRTAIHAPLRHAQQPQRRPVVCQALPPRSGGFEEARVALGRQLASARSLEDVQRILDTFGAYMTPSEVQQLVAMAPRIAATGQQRQQVPPPHSARAPSRPPHHRAAQQPPWDRTSSPAGAAAAQRLAQRRRQQALAEEQRRREASEREAQYARTMRDLAHATRQVLPQCAGDGAHSQALPETAHALAHAGALDGPLAQELLQHTASAALSGTLSVQGLAEVLQALGKAGYRPSPQTMRQLLADVNPLERCTSAQELSVLLQGMSRVGYQLQDDDALVEQVLARLQDNNRNITQQQQQEQRRSRQQAAAARAGAAQPAAPAWWPFQPRQPQTQQEPAEALVEEADEGDEDEGEEARLAEEARHVAAAAQALERMGAVQQASQLRSSYLQQLQARAAEQMQARVQRQQEQLRREREREEAERRAAEARALQQQQQQQQLRQKQQEQEEQRRRAAAAAAAAEAEAEARMRQQQQQRQREQAEAEEAERWRASIRQAVASARTWRQLRQLLYTVPLERWGADELAGLLARLPGVLGSAGAVLSWRERAEVSDLLEAWAQVFLARVGERRVGVEALVTCLEAAASLRWLEQRVLGVVLSDMRRQMQAPEPSSGAEGMLSGPQAARALVALAQAGLRPSSGWMGALFEASESRLAECGPSELQALGQALVRLGPLQPPASWTLAYLGALQAQEDSLSLPQASACLQAAASWDAPLVQRWYRGLVQSRQAAALNARTGASTSSGQQPAARQQPQQPTTTSQAASQAPPAVSGAAAVPATPAPAPALTSLSDDMLPMEVLADEVADEVADEGELQQQQQQGADTLPASPAAQASTQDAPPGQSAPPEVEVVEAAEVVEPAGATSTEAPAGAGAAMQMQLPLESVDFDEERAAAGGVVGGGDAPRRLAGDMAASDAAGVAPGRSGRAFPPDTFLLQHMTPQPPEARESQQAQGQGQQGKGAGGKAGKAGKAPTSAVSASQLRALRSVLLERLELAEETEARVAQAQQAVQGRVESAAIQLSALRGQLEVLQGDYDRVRARHEDDKKAMQQQVRQDMMARLLPVLDNFERASLSLRPKTPGEEQVHQAWAAVAQDMRALLKTAGIEEVAGEGQPFDPAVHDAIMQEVDTNVPDGTVLQVLQRGYRAGERLIRPALVKVSCQ